MTFQFLRAFALLCVPIAVACCGGEVTQLTLGNDREASFERFKLEVQPVLQAPEGVNDPELGIFRDCTAPFCHGNENGKGSELGAPLRIIKDPGDADLVENFRQVSLRIDLNSPEDSLLLTDPLTTTAHSGGLNFSGEQDCCYLIVLAWIQDADSPQCACP